MALNKTHFGYCKRGGMDGIVVTTSQLHQFATFMGAKFGDEFIPIPDSDNAIQRSRVGKHLTHDINSNVVYWEDNTGSHGWCCAECGRVVQWG